MPAQPSDVPDITAIFLDAFKDDDMLSSTWANVNPEVNQAYHTRRFSRNFEMLELDGVKFSKVVEDGTG